MKRTNTCHVSPYPIPRASCSDVLPLFNVLKYIEFFFGDSHSVITHKVHLKLRLINVLFFQIFFYLKLSEDSGVVFTSVAQDLRIRATAMLLLDRNLKMVSFMR